MGCVSKGFCLLAFMDTDSISDINKFIKGKLDPRGELAGFEVLGIVRGIQNIRESAEVVR